MGTSKITFISGRIEDFKNVNCLKKL